MKWPSLRRETSDLPPPSNATHGQESSAEAATFAPAAIDPLTAMPPGEAENCVTVPAESDERFVTPTSLPADAATVLTESSVTRQPDIPADSTCLPATGNDVSVAIERVREELLGKQQELRDAQQALNDLFSTRLRSDEAQGRAVEKLHDELRQYKTNFVRQQLLPVLKEVIFCHDFVAAQMERQASESEQSACRAFEATRQMLIDLLFKYDVEPYRSEGEAFDPKTQQCTHTLPADRVEADKTIAVRGLPGFRGPEGIVRREQVSVYKFTPGAN